MKAISVGLLGTVAATVLLFGAKLAIGSFYWRFVTTPRVEAAGGGGIGSVSVTIEGWELLLAGTAGFIAGAWWALRRGLAVALAEAETESREPGSVNGRVLSDQRRL